MGQGLRGRELEDLSAALPKTEMGGGQHKECCLGQVLSEEKTQVTSQHLPSGQRGRFDLCGLRGPREDSMGNRAQSFLPGASGGSKTPDLGISLANTRWLLLESYRRDSVLHRCHDQISESTVSIDLEKDRAMKGHFPKEEGFLLSTKKKLFFSRLKFPAQAHSEEVRAHKLCNHLRVWT